MGVVETLYQRLGADRVSQSLPLAPLTTFKVGGPAEYAYTAQTSDELVEAVNLASSLDLPVTVLGRGANVLVHDQGVLGLVIINRSHQFEISGTGRVVCDSGCDTAPLMVAAEQAGWLGLERLLKVPGTVGGAVFMNAGDTGRQQYIDELIESVTVLLPTGALQTVTATACQFGYRSSRFQHGNEIIIRAALQLQSAMADEIAAARQDVLSRKTHQPVGASCGSTFRNPTGDFAGRLVESVGLKGFQLGGAMVSTDHANFIMNTGTATASDIAQLIDEMQRRVQLETQVTLEEEVRYIGDWR